MKKLSHMLQALALSIVVAACGSSILSDSTTSVATLTDILNKQTNLGLHYEAKLPGIAGGNIEGGEIGNFPNGDDSVLVFKYSSSDGAKSFEKAARNNCKTTLVKGLFLFCFKDDSAPLEKAVKDL